MLPYTQLRNIQDQAKELEKNEVLSNKEKQNEAIKLFEQLNKILEKLEADDLINENE